MKWNEKPVHAEQYTFAEAHGVTCKWGDCQKPPTLTRMIGENLIALCDEHQEALARDLFELANRED
jgi:hypothetical protein